MLKNEDKIYVGEIIAKNFFWLFLQSIVLRVFGFFLTIILARRLTQGDFGQFTYITSLVNFFLMFSDLGLSSLLLREMSRQGEQGEEILSKIWSAKFPLILFIFAMFTASISFFPKIEQKEATFVFALAYFLVSAGVFFSIPFRANENMRFLLIGEMIYKTILIAACFYVLKLSRDLLSIAFMYLAASIAFLSFNVFVYFRYFKHNKLLVGLKMFYSNFLSVVKMAAPFAMGGVISVIYINTDILMLKWFKGESVTALYGISYSFYLAVTLVASVLVQSLFPRLSYALERNDAKTVALVLSGSFKLLFLIYAGLALGGILLSSQIISFFYGGRYLGSLAAFKIFMIITLFNSFNTLFVYYLLADGKQKEINKIFLASVALNVVINFLLIPGYSLNGAAAATLMSEFLFLLIFFIYKPGFLLYFKLRWLATVLLAALFMGLFILFFRNSIDFIPMVLSGGAVYFSVLMMSGTLKQEKELLRMIFKGLLK